MPDTEPQPSKNPFIRFKNHVDGRISSGFNLLTGNFKDEATPHQPYEQATPPLPPSLPQFSHSSPKMDNQNSLLPITSNNPPSFPTESSTLSDWTHWATHSPYSPHNLTHLRQPKPSDLPPNADDAQHLLGFHEAFEDLLAATANKPLLNLSQHLAFKRELRSLPPMGAVPWVMRLHGRGLLLSSKSLQERRRLMFDDWWTQLGLPPLADVFGEFYTPHVEALLEKAEKAASATTNFGSTGDRTELDKVAEELWELCEGAMSETQKTLWVPVREFARALMGEKPGDSEERQQRKQEGDGPATELELVERLVGAIEGANTSVVETEKDSRRQQEAQRPPPRESMVIEEDGQGGKTISSTSEHTDLFGYIHSKSETKRVDAEGRVVSCETRYHVRPSAEKVQRVEEVEMRPTKASATANGEDGKPTGWFWR